ncbi:MAG: pantoate--beta-alanine ligase [Opitutales bacterium]|nr:pantoate--beta-alanine ligase [Opitutales bacterium]
MKDIQAMQSWRNKYCTESIGFVPTMGALHAGHGALVEQARRECDLVVVSIFVNPTQFNDGGDFAAYPVESERDLQLCRELGADAVFMPTRALMYPDDYRYRVTEEQEALQWEGAHRPGHFDGVLTVVLKLFLLVRPQKAYFGEKDWQQLQLVKGMVDAFFVPVEIVACPTVRDDNGLALSSRNARLSASGRQKAAAFYRHLITAAEPDAAADALRAEGFEVEYVADTEGRRMAAIHFEGVRLIDNVAL